MKRFHPVRDLLTAAGILGLFFVTGCENGQSTNNPNNTQQTQEAIEERLTALEAMVTDTANMGTIKHREKFYEEVENLQTLNLTDTQTKALNQIQYAFLQTDFLICHSNVDNPETFPEIMWTLDGYLRNPNTHSLLENFTHTVLTTPDDGDRFISSKTIAGQDEVQEYGHGDISSFVSLISVINHFIENNANLKFNKSTLSLNYTNNEEKGNLSIVFSEKLCSTTAWTITDKDQEKFYRLTYAAPPKEEDKYGFYATFKILSENMPEAEPSK